MFGAIGATVRDHGKRGSGYQYKRPDGTLVGEDEPLSAAALLAALASAPTRETIEVRKINGPESHGRYLPFRELRVAVERAAEREAVEEAEYVERSCFLQTVD